MRKQEFIIGPGASSPDVAVAAIMQAMAERRKVRVTVAPYRKHRSTDQNRALFGLAYAAISEYTGYEKEEVHALMLKGYFGVKTVTGPFGSIERPKRTTTTDWKGDECKLNTLEFSSFYEYVCRKASEIGVIVPALQENGND